MTTGTKSNLLYNITGDEGNDSSVTVFFDTGATVATKDHPNFGRIIEALRSGEDDPKTIRDLFDTSYTLNDKFDVVSERVMINRGKVFFDGDPQDNAVTQAILRFHAEGNDNFMALVNFMEKIATNPNEHSRENLFRWMQRHKYGLHPDGDIIAYKGIGADDKSSTSGRAIVNGLAVKGRIPNVKDTVVEMARSDVNHDPSQGCSTGLHVGNWGYASTFAQKCVRVKVNPRDVVSVPTDSGDAKMRTCRYKVLGPIQSEDKTMLYVGEPERTAVVPRSHLADDETEVVKPAAAKRIGTAKKAAGRKRPLKAAPAKKAAPKVVRFPAYYERFTADHFRALEADERNWLLGEWGLTKTGTVDAKITRLVAEAKKRLKTW